MYWPVFEQHGLDALGRELHHLSKTDGWGDQAGHSPGDSDPQAVSDILTDLSRVGELSPEC